MIGSLLLLAAAGRGVTVVPDPVKTYVDCAYPVQVCVTGPAQYDFVGVSMPWRPDNSGGIVWLTSRFQMKHYPVECITFPPCWATIELPAGSYPILVEYWPGEDFNQRPRSIKAPDLVVIE